MATMSLRLPESIHGQLRTLAKREGTSINRLVVTAVADGSLADDLGLRAGDVLTFYNGRALANRDDLTAAAASLFAGQAEVEVRWLRDGVEGKGTVRPGPLGATLADR